MTNTSRPIVFFGTEEFSLTALTGLLEAGYPVEAVVTKPDAKRSRGHKLLPPPVKILATSYNISVWQPETLSDIASDIRALGSPVGVLSSYGKIIPQSIIDLFKPGIINIHPSLLPLYRGPTPIETAIANGDSKTGVSIMRLSAGLDEGPVYAAKEYLLTKKETKPELYHALANLGINLLLETLPQIIDGSLPGEPQDEGRATYTRRLNKEDAWLKPETVSAAKAEQLVRAYLGFPKTKITLDGHTVIIVKAHVADSRLSPMDIACQDNKYLAIDEVVAPSGRLMGGADFMRGYLRA